MHSDQVNSFDPCSDNYVEAYINLAEVKAALHVKPTNWTACRYTQNTSLYTHTYADLIHQQRTNCLHCFQYYRMDRQPNNPSTQNKAAYSKWDKVMDIQVRTY